MSNSLESLVCSKIVCPLSAPSQSHVATSPHSHNRAIYVLACNLSATTLDIGIPWGEHLEKRSRGLTFWNSLVEIMLDMTNTLEALCTLYNFSQEYHS
jgi:hypothetical protein